MAKRRCKQSLYLPSQVVEEIRAEADKQDRAISWVVQRAWKIARSRIKTFPAAPD